MKLRAPPGCGSVFHAERVINVDATGHVDVQEDAASALLAHGFVQVPDGASAKPNEEQSEPLNRRELFAFLKASGVSIQLPITNLELRELAATTRRGQMNGMHPTKKEG